MTTEAFTHPAHPRGRVIVGPTPDGRWNWLYLVEGQNWPGAEPHTPLPTRFEALLHVAREVETAALDRPGARALALSLRQAAIATDPAPAGERFAVATPLPTWVEVYPLADGRYTWIISDETGGDPFFPVDADCDDGIHDTREAALVQAAAVLAHAFPSGQADSTAIALRAAAGQRGTGRFASAADPAGDALVIHAPDGAEYARILTPARGESAETDASPQERAAILVDLLNTTLPARPQ